MILDKRKVKLLREEANIIFDEGYKRAMEKVEKRYDIAITLCREFALNYKNQYPKAIPNMNLIAKVIKENIK